MHVAALMIATVPAGKIVLFAILYLAVIFLVHHGPRHKELTC